MVYTCWLLVIVYWGGVLLGVGDIVSKIVRVCLGIREGEMVRIHAWGHSLDFASLLAVECFRVGAVPLITVITDQVFRDGLSVAPLEILSLPPKHEMGLLENVDAQIIISGPEDPDTLRVVSSERIQAYRRGVFLLVRLRGEIG